MTGKKIEVPKQSKGDVAHSLTKAGLSVIPVVGGPAVELFQLLIQPPLEKRRTESKGSGSNLHISIDKQ